MGVDDAGVIEPTGMIEPTAAERVCSTVAAAGSLTVTMAGHRWELVGAHTLQRAGRVLLRIPTAGELMAEVAREPRGHEAAMLGFTDVAPTAVRARVRARVRLTGWLAPAPLRPEGAEAGLRLDPSQIVLETAAGRAAVGLDELVLAQADPLAGHEADLLTHLADHHREVVALLTRLVEPRLLHGVTTVWPLALDRYGITLRLEYARGHQDVRLPFTAPLAVADQASAAIRALIVAAHACSCHRRPLTRP